MKNKTLREGFVFMTVLAMLLITALGNVTAWSTPDPTDYTLCDLQGSDVQLVIDTNQAEARVRLYEPDIDTEYVTVVQLDQDSSWKTESIKIRIEDLGYVVKDKAMYAGYSPHPLNDGNGYPDSTSDLIDDANGADGVEVEDNWKYADWNVKRRDSDTTLRSRWSGYETNDYDGACIGCAHNADGTDGIRIEFTYWDISDGVWPYEDYKDIGDSLTIYNND